jgi:hypothetical protein
MSQKRGCTGLHVQQLFVESVYVGERGRGCVEAELGGPLKGNVRLTECEAHFKNTYRVHHLRKPLRVRKHQLGDEIQLRKLTSGFDLWA